MAVTNTLDRRPKPSQARAYERTARARAVERLFEEHNRALLRYLVVRLQCEQEAKDVAQEAYVRMLQLDSPQTVSYLRAFLYKTASNLAIDRIRFRRMESRKLQMVFFGAEHASPDSSRGAAAAEEVKLLVRALQELGSECREAFVLHRLEGLGSDEIAQRMGTTRRSVQRWIAAALVHCTNRRTEKAAAGNDTGCRARGELS